jgi:hypothetical protein
MCVQEIEEEFKHRYGMLMPDALRQFAIAACEYSSSTDLAIELVQKAYIGRLALETIKKDLGGLSDQETAIVAQLITAGKGVAEIKATIEKERDRLTSKKKSKDQGPKSPK